MRNPFHISRFIQSTPKEPRVQLMVEHFNYFVANRRPRAAAPASENPRKNLSTPPRGREGKSFFRAYMDTDAPSLFSQPRLKCNGIS